MGGCITAWPLSRQNVLQIAESVLQDGMAKPPTSVRSIRLTDDAWAWLAEEAQRQVVTVNGLMARLVNAQRSVAVYDPTPEQPQRLRITKVLAAAASAGATPAEKFRGLTATGEPLPERKSYQKGPKK